MVEEDTMHEVLEDAFSDDCEVHHHKPGVRKWAGECSKSVVAILEITCTHRSGNACLNTIMGVARMEQNLCKGCGKTIRECWIVRI